MSNINTSFKQFDPDRGVQQQIELRQPAVGGGNPLTGTGGTHGAEGAQSGGFLDALEKSMQEVNQDQLSMDQSIKDIVAGKSKNIHETMLMIQKADLSLKTMMQVRNKILEAYKEIIKMQV